MKVPVREAFFIVLLVTILPAAEGLIQLYLQDLAFLHYKGSCCCASRDQLTAVLAVTSSVLAAFLCCGGGWGQPQEVR